MKEQDLLRKELEADREHLRMVYDALECPAGRRTPEFAASALRRIRTLEKQVEDWQPILHAALRLHTEFKLDRDEAKAKAQLFAEIKFANESGGLGAQVRASDPARHCAERKEQS